LFLAADGFVNVVEALVVDHAIAVIHAGEAFDLAAFVLQGTAVDAVRHSDVERAGAAADDVDEVFVVFHDSSNRTLGGIVRTP